MPAQHSRSRFAGFCGLLDTSNTKIKILAYAEIYAAVPGGRGGSLVPHGGVSEDEGALVVYIYMRTRQHDGLCIVEEEQ